MLGFRDSMAVVKLVFLGTRGGIEPRSGRHRRHTSTLVGYRRKRVLIDCGEDWRGRLNAVAPDAVVVTHGHPDHALGLVDGAPCPVFATRETWRLMERFAIPLERRSVLRPLKPALVHNILFEPFPVVHSVRAPAVGFRITAGAVSVFYVPDVVRIPRLERALRGIRLYIGDGATLTRPMLRQDRRTGTTIGHASIAAQLDWCSSCGVPEMIVTHCGSAIVRAGERRARAKLAALAEATGVSIDLAHDGMERVLR